MGYEIVLHYYDRNEEGKGFDHSESKTYKKVLGKMDDVPIEELAQLVMKQLARRDVFVHDVEIYEYTKKEITFRESKGGVLIKGMKFALDNDEIKCVGEESTEPQQQPQQQYQQPQYQQPQQQYQQPQLLGGGLRSRLLGGEPSQPRQTGNLPPQARVASRMELFTPDDQGIVAELAAKNVVLTPNKKYPIYEEKPCKIVVNFPGSGPQEMHGYNYVVMDDTANFVEVSSIHFSPEQRGLVGMNPAALAQAHAQRAAGPRLMYMRENDQLQMPVLRRGS